MVLLLAGVVLVVAAVAFVVGYLLGTFIIAPTLDKIFYRD